MISGSMGLPLQRLIIATNIVRLVMFPSPSLSKEWKMILDQETEDSFFCRLGHWIYGFIISPKVCALGRIWVFLV